MKSSILSSLSVVMGLVLPNLVFAQAGSGAGNGGHPAEVAEMQGANGVRLESWYTVKQDLIKGLELGRHSELTFDAGVTADSFKASAMNALKTTVLDFGDQKIEIAGARRACRNWVDANQVGRIYCDLPYLIETMKLFDSEAQYRFIAHEYLSVAGLEPNEYGSSSYFYSSQISKSLRTVESKRWGVMGAQSKQTLAQTGIFCSSWGQEWDPKNILYFAWKPNGDYFAAYQKFPRIQHDLGRQDRDQNVFGEALTKLRRNIGKQGGFDIVTQVLYRGNSMGLVTEQRSGDYPNHKYRTIYNERSNNDPNNEQTFRAYTTQAIETIPSMNSRRGATEFALSLHVWGTRKVPQKFRYRVHTLQCAPMGSRGDVMSWIRPEQIFNKPTQNEFRENLLARPTERFRSVQK